LSVRLINRDNRYWVRRAMEPAHDRYLTYQTCQIARWRGRRRPPFNHPAMARPEQSRNSAGPVPELDHCRAAFATRQLPGMAMFNPMMLSMAIGIAFHNIVG